MAKHVMTYRCLVISPSDVPEHREAVERAIQSWNAHTGPLLNARIEPVLWELHARPQIGTGPQQVLNDQIVDDVDFGIAFFWTKVGTPTPDHESGSVEEIERLLKREAEVMVYFCDAPVPQETLTKDPAQFIRLQEVRKRYEARGVVRAYDTPERLRELVSLHVNGTVNAMLTQEQDGPDHETRAAMRARELRLEKLRAVRNERVAKVIARETPKPVGPGPKLILHVMPMRESNLFERIMAVREIDRLNLLRPMWDGLGFDMGNNYDGWVTYGGGSTGEFMPYVQLFHDGVLEAVGRVWNSRDTQPPRFSGDHIETDAYYTLEQWQRLYQLVEEPAPIYIALTITNVRGYNIPMERDYFGREAGNVVDRDTLQLPEIIEDDLSKPADVILKPVFDRLWQASGWKGSPNYKDGRHRQSG